MKKQTASTPKTPKKPKEKALMLALIIFLGMIALGVVCLIIGIAIPGLMLFAAIFAITFILGGVYIYFYAKKTIKHSFCPKCEEKYKFDSDISWEEVQEIDSGDKVVSVVEFKCVCHNCKEKQEFTEKFQVSYYDKKKECWIENSLSSMVKKHFWNSLR